MGVFLTLMDIAISEDHPALADSKRVAVDSIIRLENSVADRARSGQISTKVEPVTASRISEFRHRPTQTVFRHLASQCCVGGARNGQVNLNRGRQCLHSQGAVQQFRREGDFDICGEAGNGRDAIEKAKQLRPDLIVLDLSMPVMNGVDAAHVLKRLMPKVPLIMYSAFGDGYVEQQASLLGVSAVVSKSEPATTVVGAARSLLTQTAA